MPVNLGEVMTPDALTVPLGTSLADELLTRGAKALLDAGDER